GKDRSDGAPDRRATGRPPGLVPVPAGIADPVLMDGPVELEGPVETADLANDPLLDPVLSGAADLDDADSERGGIFRARDLGRDREPHRQASGRPGDAAGAGRAGRPGGPVPLPRRKPPTLVADNGRRVDEAGRAHPVTAEHGPSPRRGGDRGPVTDEPVAGVPGIRSPGTDGATRSAAAGPWRSEAGADDSAAPHDTTGPREPAGPRKSAGSAPAAAAGGEGATASRPPRETVGGLPRRIRQASLAPQLREVTGGRDAEPARTGPARDFERDADEVRDRMASLQRGWQRGRRQNAEDMTGPGDTAQGTTSEGDGR
ncbi:histidine kinase, partial [Streptomyces sp. NPDC057545]